MFDWRKPETSKKIVEGEKYRFSWKEILNGDNLFGLEFTVEQQKAEDISILKLIKSIGPMSANAVKLDETVDNLKMSLLILTKS